MHHGIVRDRVNQSPLSAQCITGSRETVVNIIAQLPVSNNIAELPGLAHGVPCRRDNKIFCCGAVRILVSWAQ